MKRILIFLLLLSCAAPLLAQNQKISAMTSGNPPQNGDLIPIARSGANLSLTIAQIIAAAAAGIPSGGVTNAMLANSSITVVAGSGLSGGGSVALGGSVTLTNTASGGTVTSVATGSGLTGGPCTTTCTVSIASGAVTNTMLANSSVTVTAGSGLSGGGTVALGGSITLTNTSSGGTVTSVGTTSPLSGTVSTAGNLSCPACTVRIASGSQAMGTSAILSGDCATVVSVSATGTLTTDVPTASFNEDVTGVTGYLPSTSGTLRIDVYPTADHINFKICNETANSVTPGALTLNYIENR